MSLNVPSASNIIPPLKTPDHLSPNAQQAGGAQFSTTLKSLTEDVSRFITPSETAQDAQKLKKKRRIEAIEDDRPKEEEDSLVKTVHEIAKKLKNLAELERRARGL